MEIESFGFDCPTSADELIGREALQGLQTAAEIVGADEVLKVAFELTVAVVVIALDGRILDRPVHPLDLSVRPWMIDLGEAMLDAVFPAAHREHVSDIVRWSLSGGQFDKLGST